MEEKNNFKSVITKQHIHTRKRMLFFSLLYLIFAGASTVRAASLYLSPSSGSHAVNQSFSVGIYASSDEAMNASSGVLSFPTDKLQVVSVSKSGSIFSLWAQDPSFSNSNGEVHFEGVVLNPGYTGSSGKILTITFKPTSEGSAKIHFSSGSILANDGAGTNIYTGAGSGTYTVSGTAPAPPEKPSTPPTKTETETTPQKYTTAPVVLSPTHADSEKWYNNNNPQFSWELPNDATGVSTILSQETSSDPGSTSDGLVTETSYENVDDGVWYFHIKLKNSSGWGPVTHYKIQIDTEAPKPFTISFVDPKESTTPQPRITFHTSDALSGLSHYQIKIGTGNFIEITPDTVLSSPYTLPAQDPGTYPLIIQAIDNAGNNTTAVEEYTILALDAPQITRYQNKLQEGDILYIGGMTYPEASIQLYIFKDGKKVLEQHIRSTASGDFDIVGQETLPRGTYEIQAQVTDDTGAKSLLSEKIVFVVTSKTWAQVGSWLISLLSITIPLVVLIIALLFVFWYSWYKFSSLRKKVRVEMHSVESMFQATFGVLKDKVHKHMDLLEKASLKRDLTREEQRFMMHLKKYIAEAEQLHTLERQSFVEAGWKLHDSALSFRDIPREAGMKITVANQTTTWPHPQTKTSGSCWRMNGDVLPPEGSWKDRTVYQYNAGYATWKIILQEDATK